MVLLVSDCGLLFFFVENVSDYNCNPPVKMSLCSRTKQLFHCGGVRHLGWSPICLWAGQMFTRPLPSEAECVGRWKEQREDGSGARWDKRCCVFSWRLPVITATSCSRALRCSCSLPALVFMRTILIPSIDSLCCYTAFIMKWEREREKPSPCWLFPLPGNFVLLCLCAADKTFALYRPCSELHAVFHLTVMGIISASGQSNNKAHSCCWHCATINRNIRHVWLWSAPLWWGQWVGGGRGGSDLLAVKFTKFQEAVDCRALLVGLFQIWWNGNGC